MTKEETEALQVRIIADLRGKNNSESYGMVPYEKYAKRKEDGTLARNKFGGLIVDWNKHAPNNGGILATRRELPGLPSTLTMDRYGNEGGRMVAVKVNGEPSSWDSRSLPYPEPTEEKPVHRQNYRSNGTVTTAKLNEWYEGLDDVGNDGTTGKVDVNDYISCNMDENNISDYVEYSEETFKEYYEMCEGDGTFDSLVNKARNDVTKENPNLSKEQLEAKVRARVTKLVYSEIFAHKLDSEGRETSEYVQPIEVRGAFSHEAKINLRIFAAKAAPAFDKPGGAVQIEFPVSIEMMKEAGMIVDDERVSPETMTELETLFEAARKGNLDLTIDEFWNQLDDQKKKELIGKVQADNDRESKKGAEKTEAEQDDKQNGSKDNSEDKEEIDSQETEEPTGPEESEADSPEIEETAGPEVEEPTNPEEPEVGSPEVEVPTGQEVDSIQPEVPTAPEGGVQPRTTRSPGEVREAAEADIDYSKDAAVQVIEQIKADLNKEIEGQSQPNKTDMDLDD